MIQMIAMVNVVKDDKIRYLDDNLSAFDSGHSAEAARELTQNEKEMASRIIFCPAPPLALREH